MGPTGAPGNCNEPWINDNYCDDINNNEECEFDGGDCCQENPAEGWDNYCEACECLDAPEPTTQAPTTVGPVNNGTCNAGWIADSFCDDINNNPECGFDGGDCCDNDGEGWDNYCSLCECLEMPETTEPPMETTEEPWYTT